MPNNSLRVTRCPHCDTSFRVTPAQLRAANGSVRCGSCLQIFTALSHLEGEQPSPEPALSAETEVTDKEPSQAEIQSETSPSPETPEPIANSEDSTDFHIILETLDKEQVEVEGEGEDKGEKKKTPKRQIAWSALTALCLITLVLQYLWFNKDTLSLDPRLREAYSWSCEQLGCSLPLLVDVSQIKSTQLLVRSHPERDRVLVVDTVIINEGPFPQPWPLLSLSFTDLDSQPVASRRFNASEFLGGEMAGSREIPPGQPIRLSLEIIDPGQDAVSYSLRFFPDKSLY